MKLNKTWKIIVGLATLWVAAYPFLLLLFMFLIMFPTIAMSEPSSDIPPSFIPGFFAFFILMMLSSFLQMGVSIFYFIHIIKNKNGLDVLRIILGVGIFYMPYFALPIYYFFYIWPETIPVWALEKSE